MDPQRWRQLRPLLEQALDCEDDERETFVASLAADLQVPLRELLRAHGRPAALDLPVAQQLASVVLAADSDPAIGGTFGPYRIERLLGEGGMGAVYLASRFEGGFQQQVALKLIRGEFAHPGSRERFARERQILAGLQHPQIARLLDGGQTASGTAWFTLEYVDGQTITDYCRNQSLDLKARIALLRQLAGALAHAHRQLVVHRDIKPGNILVSADGAPKLLDFGIAKLLDEAPGAPLLTQAALGPMTPAYAAPEQFRGQAVTVATDVYQFGVLAFVLLTGHLPYSADPADVLDWARAVTEEEPLSLQRAAAAAGSVDAPAPELAWLKKLPRSLRQDLDAVLRVALAKDPAARYRSMDALADDLGALLDGRPVRVSRASSTDRLRRFIGRHQLAFATATLFVLALASTAGLALWQAARAAQQAQRAEATVDFLIGMFQVADPASNPGDRMTVNTMLAQGAQRLQDSPQVAPDLRGRLLKTIGELFITLGEFDQALPLLQQAVLLLPEGDRRARTQAMRLSAQAQFKIGASSRAGQLLLQAEDLAAGGADLADERAGIALLRGQMLRSEGRFEQALERYDQALRHAGQIADSDAAQRMRQSLRQHQATARNDLGQSAVALQLVAEAAALCNTLYGPHHWRCIGVRESEGWILADTDQLDRAQQLLEAALADKREVFGEHNILIGNSYYNLGNLAVRRQQFVIAEEHYRRAAAIYSKHVGADHPDVAWALSNAANAVLQQGRLEDALAVLAQCQQIWRNADVLQRRPLAASLRASVGVLLELRRPAVALPLASEALALSQAEFGDQGEDVARSLQSLGQVQLAVGDSTAGQASLQRALQLASAVKPVDPGLLEEIRAALMPAADTS